MFDIVVRVTAICVLLMYRAARGHIPAVMAALAAAVTSARRYSSSGVVYSAVGTAALVAAVIALVQ